MNIIFKDFNIFMSSVIFLIFITVFTVFEMMHVFEHLFINLVSIMFVMLGLFIVGFGSVGVPVYAGVILWMMMAKAFCYRDINITLHQMTIHQPY